MKKLLLFACALFGFMACTQNPIEEQSAIRIDAPETIRVGFEDDETRIQLNEVQKTVWTKDDLVSVFYRSDANQKWQYQGETGERVGDLKCVDAGTATESMKRVVVVYPYNENYYINTETYNVQATLPATQHYLANSYGTDGNIMISSSEYNQFSLKSVCGWLKLQLTGDGEVVKSIKFRGNDDEQVAGLIYVDTATAEATLASEMGSSDDNNAGGNLVFDDTILTEVILDCGEGVTLGAKATSFYISLPPQTFANGFTVEIECEDYKLMTLTTEKEFVIERNHIQPMASVEHNAEQIIPNNEIRYTNGSTTEATTPDNTNAFGANIVSNTYDVAKECWVITFDDDVTAIGNYAFFRCSSLTSITIPDSVTTIGYQAFLGCRSLTSITIPDSVTKIGERAFYLCESLQEFNGKFASEDSRCLIIDEVLNSFAIGCGATEYTIPDSVTTIGNYAFYDCNKLTSVTISDSVTTIGYYAFQYCSSLTSVTIPNSVTEIGEFAFYDCSSLTSVTIGDSVTTIGDYAFSYCNSLTSVTIPDSVTTIGYAAFRNCYSLTSVYCKATTPPAGGSSMFSYNASGRKIYVPMGSAYKYKSASGWSDYKYDIVGYDFENGVVVTPKPANNEIWYTNGSTTKATTPSATGVFGRNIVSNTYDAAKECWVIKFDGKVTTIGDSAFYGCSRLTSVTIPDSVTKIRYGAFYGCSSLTSVTIPDSVTTIGEWAFYKCSSLTSVTIGDSVTTIGDHAFYQCSSLTSVTIPDSVTTIGDYAFYGCTGELIINNKIVETDYDSSNYPFKSGWLKEAKFTKLTIGDSVTTIGDYAFYGCSRLTSVTIPDSVTWIGDSAFYGCSGLISVTIPDSVTTIGDHAFDFCYSLTSVTIPDSVTTIGDYAFAWCSSFTSVTIPDSVTTIGNYAFYDCNKLTSVTIPDSVTTIGEGAFYYCRSLTSVTIPDSVTTIGNSAFEDCSNLTSVYCKATTPPVGGSDMFYNNASGRKIYVPAGSVNAYKSVSYWRDYKSYIVGYNF